MTDEKQPPLYEATVDVDWPVRGKKRVLKAGKRSDKVPPETAAWMLACGALEEVTEDDSE